MSSAAAKSPVADFPRLHEPHPMLAVAPQWDLLNLLAEAGKAEPTFTLLMNTEVTGILREGEKVTGVRYQGPGGPGKLRADLTVAADGRASAVRRDAGLVPKEFSVPFDVGWFRLDTITPIKYQLTPRSAPGISLAMIPRPGYFQTGLFMPKGGEAELRARGLDTFRAQIADLIPEADANSLTSWDDIKILDVRVNRLRTWHKPGLLCIGDAAHAMSPVGGVGVNLAIADAVAAARILAEPLLQHRITDADLAAVQKRRKLPTIISQTIQQLMQQGMRRTLTGGPPPKVPKSLARIVAGVLIAFPPISVVPAYVVGVGFRAERCPNFARRPAQQ